MFRIRKVHDDTLPVNRHAITQVQEILRTQFPLIGRDEVAALPGKLRDPLSYRFRTILLVAEDWHHRVLGFALVLHLPDLDACFLDFMSVEPAREGRGVGGALYERVRSEALALDCDGVFIECLPDAPELSPDPDVRADNERRLRFYERFGARPIVGTRYETPLRPGDDNPPYLLYDALGDGKPLRRPSARAIVRAILERKYATVVSAEYTDMVVRSIRDDPVRLRDPRWHKASAAPPPAIPADRRIALVVTDRHEIHHVRERGYVEAPVRIRTLRRELDRTDLFDELKPRRFAERHILAVHDGGWVRYFKRVCRGLPQGRSVYPYVFPIRNRANPPRELAVRAGYYCIDTFTPLNGHAFEAARRAADCALTAADALLGGMRLAYALVRPPGHHAERSAFGGFCYFNSTAIAAHYLSGEGRVAVLDIDYHHGNGTQDIFFRRADVLTVSIHGHPSFAYPYFSGFDTERGEDGGEGFNLNLPLPEQVDGEAYRRALGRALAAITRFAPDFLVVALGYDTARGDPTGSWSLRGRDFQAIGRRIGELGLPTLAVQEGGYDNRAIGANARSFFTGLWEGAVAAER